MHGAVYRCVFCVTPAAFANCCTKNRRPTALAMGAEMKRRAFLQRAAAAPALAALAPRSFTSAVPGAATLPAGRYSPGRIVNEYNLLLPGEKEELENFPRVHSFT